MQFKEITNIINNLNDLSKLLPIQLINFSESAIFVHNSKSKKKENKKLAICIPFPLFKENKRFANKMKKNKYKLI